MTAARILATALITLASTAHAYVPCNHTDKTMTTRHAEHLVGSAAIAGAATYATDSRLEGFGIAFGVGLLKEMADTQNPKDAFTCKSLVADALGAAIGAQLGGWFIKPDTHGAVVGWTGEF
jgi:uncharacterized protein YfiM (DUF2279 family)